MNFYLDPRVLHKVHVVLVFIVSMVFVFAFIQTGNSKFMPRTVIETTAILSLDEEIKLNSDEVGFYKMVLIFLNGYNTILTPPTPPPPHNSHHGNRRKWLLSTGLYKACLLKKVAVEESWLQWADGL